MDERQIRQIKSNIKWLLIAAPIVLLLLLWAIAYVSG